jgi:hypothetical protein
MIPSVNLKKHGWVRIDVSFRDRKARALGNKYYRMKTVFNILVTVDIIFAY